MCHDRDMAVPLIVSVVPSSGHTGGRTLVEITGENFRLPTPPPAQGLTTPPPPSVRVLVGGVEALRVWVVSPTLLRVLTPINDPSGTPATNERAAVPASDVVVENIDDAGVLIAGETTTRAAAFSFVRPRYDVECHLERVVKAFIVELKRQVLDNVQWNPHADFDPMLGGSFLDLDNPDVAQRSLAHLPGIALINVGFTDSKDQSTDTQHEIRVDDATWIARRAPVAQDISCTLVGASDNTGELLRMFQATRLFFMKNPDLVLPRDPNNIAAGAIGYQMDFAAGERVEVSARTTANVETFSAGVTIRGVLLEDIPGLPTDGVPGTPAGVAHEATVEKGRTVERFLVDPKHRR